MRRELGWAVAALMILALVGIARHDRAQEGGPATTGPSSAGTSVEVTGAGDGALASDVGMPNRDLLGFDPRDFTTSWIMPDGPGTGGSGSGGTGASEGISVGSLEPVFPPDPAIPLDMEQILQNQQIESRLRKYLDSGRKFEAGLFDLDSLERWLRYAPACAAP